MEEEDIENDVKLKIASNVERALVTVRKKVMCGERDGGSNLCIAIETVMLHGLRDHSAAKTNPPLLKWWHHLRALPIPEPSFWAVLAPVLHRDMLTLLCDNPYIRTDVGRCRSWLRLALNEASLLGYLTALHNDRVHLDAFYNPLAFMLDAKRLAPLLLGLRELSCVTFDLPYRSAALNEWTVTPLALCPHPDTQTLASDGCEEKSEDVSCDADNHAEYFERELMHDGKNGSPSECWQTTDMPVLLSEEDIEEVKSASSFSCRHIVSDSLAESEQNAVGGAHFARLSYTVHTMEGMWRDCSKFSVYLKSGKTRAKKVEDGNKVNVISVKKQNEDRDDILYRRMPPHHVTKENVNELKITSTKPTSHPKRHISICEPEGISEELQNMSKTNDGETPTVWPTEQPESCMPSDVINGLEEVSIRLMLDARLEDAQTGNADNFSTGSEFVIDPYWHESNRNQARSEENDESQETQGTKNNCEPEKYPNLNDQLEEGLKQKAEKEWVKDFPSVKANEQMLDGAASVEKQAHEKSIRILAENVEMRKERCLSRRSAIRKTVYHHPSGMVPGQNCEQWKYRAPLLDPMHVQDPTLPTPPGSSMEDKCVVVIRQRKHGFSNFANERTGAIPATP
uniref:RUN domain-containing protein n=1 Tax=Eptatretus burgeri TaxID=7764 RepID=A0A8C4NEW9_EPTBU